MSESSSTGHDTVISDHVTAGESEGGEVGGGGGEEEERGVV